MSLTELPGLTPPTGSAGRSLRILVVDDCEDNRFLVECFLARTPHQVIAEETGAGALARFGREPFDLVLMDLQMPGMDGCEATRALRAVEAEQRRAPVPVLVLTASCLREDEQRCAAAGCSGYLTKPISRAGLLQAVADHAG